MLVYQCSGYHVSCIVPLKNQLSLFTITFVLLETNDSNTSKSKARKLTKKGTKVFRKKFKE